MNKTNQDIKTYVRIRDKGICQNCGVYCWDKGNIAHRIAQSKVNIKVYGNKIIDSHLNKVWTCFSNTCNSSFNIGNNLGKSQRLVKLINDSPNKYFDAKFITEKINE